MRRRRLAVLAAVALVALALVALAASSPLGVTDSAYGYSITVATNATLSNVTLVLPLPAAPVGTGPVVAAFQDGEATVPAGWTATVVEAELGPALRLEAATVTAERQSDGRPYATYAVTASVPAADAVDTGDPYGTEPTVGPVDGRLEVPCPNQAGPVEAGRCFAFDVPVYLAYDAPPDASVDVYLVATGANEHLLGGRRQFYERVTLFPDGPQDGWVTAEGFASTSG